MKTQFKQDKGTAGLTLLLSIIVMLFIIGLVVMIFSLMGSELYGSDTVLKQYSSSATQTELNITDGSSLTACGLVPNGAISGVTSIINNTILGAITTYTTSGCVLTNATNNMELVNVTYTYTYSGASYEVMNDTITGVSGVTDWFDIFIVISAMVVLILLTVIIITAIRSSGMIEGGTTSGANRVGTA